MDEVGIRVIKLRCRASDGKFSRSVRSEDESPVKINLPHSFNWKNQFISTKWCPLDLGKAINLVLVVMVGWQVGRTHKVRFYF